MRANPSVEVPAVMPARVSIQEAGPAGHGVNGYAHGTNGHTNGHTNGRAAPPAGPPLSPSADGAARPGQDAATGKFLPGNKLGKGNPHYRRLAANRTAFLEAVGPEQVKELAARLCARAQAGDLEAAKIVLAYAIGRPGPAADPDRADLDEWQLLDGWPTLAQVLRSFIDGAEVAEAVDLVHEVRAGASRRPLLDRLRNRDRVVVYDVDAERRKRSGRKEE
jgi:hypothetical protein